MGRGLCGNRSRPITGTSPAGSVIPSWIARVIITSIHPKAMRTHSYSFALNRIEGGTSLAMRDVNKDGSVPARREHRWRAAILLALLLSAVLSIGSAGLATSARAESADETTTEDDSPELEFSTIEELRGKKLGMLTGAIFDKLLLDNCEGFSQDDIMFFNTNAETVGALQAKKIDAMITDLPIGQLAVNKNAGIALQPEPIQDDKYGYVLQKNSKLTAKVNERIAAYHEDGTIEKLKQEWIGSDDSEKKMPEQDWDTPNGTITIATSVDNEPINYCIGDMPCGMCIELIELIARDLGYGVEYRTTNTGSLIAEVQSGKADMAAYSFSITEERKKMVDMTEPFYDGGVTVVVRTTGSDADANVGFFEGLGDSFQRTFMEEDRWRLILEGLGVTLLISVVSGSLGLVLGFVFVLLRRKKEGGLADRIIRLLENVLGGLPVVVVLMIFYYVLFGSVNISGIIVAVMVFTLLFGASSGSIMWNAIRAVDIGQTEAGRALGFSDRDTFGLVVLPQAARQFSPLLLSQFVNLVKDTSIVGYIAVQDLTRVGDLIRARTMEAFFPLVITAIIYFAICRLMAWLLGRLVKKLEPKEGPRTIKGVEL